MDTKHHKNYDLPFDVGKTFLLLILFLMSSSAFAGSQTVVLPENPCSIGIIVSAIKDQTGMSVDFSQGVLNLEKKVRMKSKLERVTTLMDELSAKENVEYEISGRHIIVTSRAKTVKEVGAAQQDKVTIRGTVTDKNGDPLIGASVKVKGQNIATVTDIDGKYSLTVARGSVLVCTYVGFVTTEQTANGNRSVDFVLDEQNRSLNELIVIGYGSQKKQSLTGAISAISADFDQAISLLPVSFPERGRVNKNVAYGLKARAMIYAGSIAKYNDVNFRDAKTGDRVCGMDPSLARDFFLQAYEAAKAVSGYKLYKDEWKADDKKAQYTNYCHIFNNVTNSEVMLAREFSYPDDVHGYNAYNVPHQLRGGNGYSSETNPTLDFVEMFDGLQKDADGHIDVYNADNTYKLYDDPMDLFKDAEPRLRANVVFPNDVMSGQNIEIWRGIYTAQDASTGKINRLISVGETRTYQSIPEVDAKIVYSSNDSQTPYTLHNGHTMNPAGRSGYFTGSGDCALSGFSVRKYISETLTDDNTLENHDDDPWIELRYAEVLVTEAEAAAELASYGDNSKLNEAYECINQIRERAGANLLSDDEKNGVDNFIQVVRKERRRELAFENKIWWDLKRWRVIDKEQNNRRWRVLMPFYADHAGKWFFDARYDEGNRIYTFDTRWYYQEIPSNAISSSNNLIIQNPGY